MVSIFKDGSYHGVSDMRNIKGLLREYSFNEHSESAHTQTLEQTQVTPGEHCQLQQNRPNCLWFLPRQKMQLTNKRQTISAISRIIIKGEDNCDLIHQIGKLGDQSCDLVKEFCFDLPSSYPSCHILL